MTDREKLVELLAQACEWRDRCVGCEKNLPIAGTCKEEKFGKAADHLIANGVTVQGWRDARTDPPEEYRDECMELIPLLVACEDTDLPFRAVYDGENWGDGWSKIPVTHWMPLPKPALPKKKGE